MDMITGFCTKNKIRKTFFLILIFLNPLFLLSLEEKTIQSSSGVKINFTFRALKPGEILIVSLEEDLPVSKVIMTFLEKKYVIGNRGGELERRAFVGLDLGLKPDLYLMKINIQNVEGEWETINAEIGVTGKEFPTERLWVEEKFVTPPSSVKERIRRESDVIGMVNSVITPHWLGSGKFIMPCEGEISSDFGLRRIYNNKPRSSHSGIDISLPHGEPVYASNSGQVVLASDLYYSGKTVIIDHGLGLFSQYMHFSRIHVKRGQFVSKGDLIGDIGATGRVTGPHLHWGIRLLGARVDPFALLELPFE